MPDDFPYHIDVFYSTEDKAWIAAVPDLQNANASGDTPHAAVEELGVVTEMWLESWLEKHDKIPPARYRPQPVSPLSQAG